MSKHLVTTVRRSIYTGLATSKCNDRITRYFYIPYHLIISYTLHSGTGFIQLGHLAPNI